MAILPNSREEMIQWIENRIAVWAAAPTAIGLTMAEVTELASRLNTAKNDLDSVVEIRIQSKSLTSQYHLSSDALRSLAADMIKVIRARAEVTNDPSIYNKALIPQPATPTPLGPPATPTDLAAAINSAGYIDLAWKGSREGGTQFIIQRQAIPLEGNNGPWSSIAAVAGNDFADTSVPIGVRGVNYRVYAQRSGGNSAPTESTTVYFGTAADSAVLAKKKITGEPSEFKIAS